MVANFCCFCGRFSAATAAVFEFSYHDGDGAGDGNGNYEPLLVCGNVAAISVAAVAAVAAAFCYALFTALMRDLGLAYTLSMGTACV